MILDIRPIPGDSPIEADLCIVGCGAAGIVLARELISSPYQVVVVESGGLRPERAVQDLYSGDCIGEPYYESLDGCRTRYFGGSTNCWAGMCTLLNEIDFERRSWVPGSGWPIGFGELMPYLRQAHQLLEPGPFLYDSRAWETMGIPPGGFSPELFQCFVWHFTNRSEAGIRFGRRFRRELRQASNVRVLLHANATELLTDASGRRVERLDVATLDGQKFQVKARAFVLACGGIENARILLASTSHSPNGLGNEQDLVGRFFHEHLHVPCATLFVPQGGHAGCYSRLSRLEESFCLPGLSLTPRAQADHGTLNGSISVEPYYEPESALIAFRELRANWKARRFTHQTFRHVWTLAREGRRAFPEVWRRVIHGDRPRGEPDRFILYARAEQAPNRDSRIILSNHLDALGMRRVSLDWHTTPLDRKAIRLLATFAAEEFTRLGLGRVIPADWLAGERWPQTLAGGPHHMGTTRMSDDASTGVTDRNGRVHGLHGLYVTGSSLFPTGGHANPTLTIVALVLRLAGHLRAALAGDVPVSHAVSGTASAASGAKPLPAA
jgi:choline dehydrogenase-like flavoprotein